MGNGTSCWPRKEDPAEVELKAQAQIQLFDRRLLATRQQLNNVRGAKAKSMVMMRFARYEKAKQTIHNRLAYNDIYASMQNMRQKSRHTFPDDVQTVDDEMDQVLGIGGPEDVQMDREVSYSSRNSLLPQEDPMPLPVIVPKALLSA